MNWRELWLVLEESRGLSCPQNVGCHRWMNARMDGWMKTHGWTKMSIISYTCSTTIIQICNDLQTTHQKEVQPFSTHLFTLPLPLTRILLAADLLVLSMALVPMLRAAAAVLAPVLFMHVCRDWCKFNGFSNFIEATPRTALVHMFEEYFRNCSMVVFYRRIDGWMWSMIGVTVSVLNVVFNTQLIKNQKLCPAQFNSQPY